MTLSEYPQAGVFVDLIGRASVEWCPDRPAPVPAAPGGGAPPVDDAMSAVDHVDFSISCEPGVGGTTLRVAGEVDLETAPGLREAVLGAAGAGATQVVVEMAEVTFIDASGLNALVAAHTGLQGRGAHLAIHAPSPMARTLLALSGIDRVIEIVHR